MRDIDRNDETVPVPAVLGADWAAEQRGEEPTLAYVPSEQVFQEDRDVTVQLVRLDDGRTVLPAFTSLDALVANLGQTQPWVSFPSDRLGDIQVQSGSDEILWDPQVPVDLRAGSEH